MQPYEIKSLREKLNLTQQELADKLGCARPRIAEWEAGRFKISKAYLQLLRQIKPD